MKIVVAAIGACGALYVQRLLALMSTSMESRACAQRCRAERSRCYRAASGTFVLHPATIERTTRGYGCSANFGSSRSARRERATLAGALSDGQNAVRLGATLASFA